MRWVFRLAATPTPADQVFDRAEDRAARHEELPARRLLNLCARRHVCGRHKASSARVPPLLRLFTKGRFANNAGAYIEERLDIEIARLPMYSDVSLFIDGGWRPAASGRTLPVLNPATGEAIGQVAHAEKADLDAALAGAQKGFAAWRKVSAHDRYRLMRKAADILRSHAAEIVRTDDAGAGQAACRSRGETLAGADIIDWFAEEARRAYGRIMPSRGDGVYQIEVKEPVGPVAAFTPWNFPINQAVRKMSGAIAAGCSIILKGPEETPASCAALVSAFVEAGLPAGVVNLVFGVPAEISGYLIPHPVIRKISFTGSTAVGKQLAALAGAHMKRVTMELGGHAPAIVFEDADIDAAAKILGANKFRNAGQVCVSPTRFLVQEPVYEQFVEKFVDRRESAQGRRRLARRNAHGAARPQPPARGDGGLRRRRRRQGRQDRDRRPAHRQQGLLLRAHRAHRCADRRAHHERGAVRAVAIVNPSRPSTRRSSEANRLPYGLAAYAYTRSTKTAAAIGQAIESGMVSINHHGLALPEAPFGGVKDSGYGSEGGADAIEAYLNTKFITQMSA